MAFRMRSSKFRHIYGRVAKKEMCYENIAMTRNAHEGQYCAVNTKFVAMVTDSGGGSAFMVLLLDKTGRVEINTPKIYGHKGAILDIKWNPFNDQVIATCSDDASVKLWQIPDKGPTSNMSDWLVDLHGHQKRVSNIEWHPTAENIIISAGSDFKCILWNTESAEPINIILCHNTPIYSISWNLDGSLFATTAKDKKVRVIDPRTGDVLGESVCHLGPKASQVKFLGDTNRVFTTGFSRMNARQYAVWNIKDMSKPLTVSEIDSSSGILFPFYDHDIRVMYIAGKGDGNIRFFEIVDSAPYCHYLGQYSSPSPQRCLGYVPKRGVDVTSCEIMRFYKIYGTKGFCEPISMIVPRKTESFHEDIYPPTPSSTPSLTADEWTSGQNRDPILISLQDGHLYSNPVITTSKAVQRKDGSLQQTPVITTYKAVQSSPRDLFGASPVSPGSPVPNSVRNIQKLSSSMERSSPFIYGHNTMSGDIRVSPIRNDFTVTQQVNDDSKRKIDKKIWSPAPASNDIPANMLPNTNPEPIPKLCCQSPIGSPSNTSVISSNTSQSDSPVKKSSRLDVTDSPSSSMYYTPQKSFNYDMKVEIIETSPPILTSTDRKKKVSDNISPEHQLVKPSSLRMGNGEYRFAPMSRDIACSSPNKPDITNNTKLHIHKVWSPPPSPLQQSSIMTNGFPQTDPELRKAYFRQLEEIKSLKQQIAMKDMRIAQLENDVKCSVTSRWSKELDVGRGTMSNESQC